jgi:outer membrane protein, adhesin transport system
MRRILLLPTAFFLYATTSVGAAEVYSINDAILQAVRTHPGVGEASANRRATESELRQSQGTLLPQVRVQADHGPEKLRRYITPAPVGNGDWQNGSNVSVTVRQLVFDGFTSINEIWRQAARVDAAAARVHERTELIALDAAEAYIDVVRYLRLVSLAEANVAEHKRILGNVRSRFSGGRSGEGDLQQAQERVSAAEAVLADFRRSLDEARAKYRRAVGLEPYNVRFPGRLPAMPGSKDESLAVALRHNPTIRAAGSDAEAAKYGFRSTAGAFVPTVSLEGRALRGNDSDNLFGRRDEVSGKVVMSWDIFRGGQDLWRRNETAERMIEANMRHARLQREAFEALDKAWAARTITSERISALLRQVEAARRVVAAYTKEYELGQRTLIDLLDAENQLFNAQVSVVSTRGVAVFADYQLLAAMGHLLEYLKTAPPPEALPLEVQPVGLFPTKLPPIILTEPGPGPEPLNVAVPLPPAPPPAPGEPPPVIRFTERWPQQQPSQQSVVANMGLSGMQGFAAASPADAGIDSRWPQPALSFGPQGMTGPLLLTPSLGAGVN